MLPHPATVRVFAARSVAQRLVTAVAALAVTSACAGSATTDLSVVAPAATASAQPSPTQANAPQPGDDQNDEAAQPGLNELPKVMVRDVATGEEVALDSFAPSDQPLLLWLWAPH
jgi:predicted RecA/RadA family phage recombinase